MVLRLVLATGLGLLVGNEREQARNAAGLRTHGMVSLGSALFAIISLHGFGYLGDPAWLAAQVVSGIGFLGAGAIIQQRVSVQGLTTAASLWATAAIGLAAGVGMIVMPVVAFLFTTAPVAAHMIGRAAYFSRVPLWPGTLSDDLAGRYDARTHELFHDFGLGRPKDGEPPVRD